MRTFVLDPFGGSSEYMQDRIFNSPYGTLRELLRLKGIDLHTYDMTGISSADTVFCFNYRKRFLQACLRSGIPRDKMVLFLYEPNVVMSEQYSPSVWRYYGKIFTYRDDLIGRPGFFKMRLPQEQQLLDSFPSFSDRRFLTMINANKYSYVDGELYSYRRRAIRFFEETTGDFDLYGHGWGQNAALRPGTILKGLSHRKPRALIKDIWQGFQKFSSYRGVIDRKHWVLSRYKYSLCFENDLAAPGYITEKIFDCLISGTIPVYLGAGNIEQYIPKDCYIDMRTFPGFPELYTYLLEYRESDFLRTQDAGQRFIRSDAFAKWRSKYVFQDIADVF